MGVKLFLIQQNILNLLFFPVKVELDDFMLGFNHVEDICNLK